MRWQARVSRQFNHMTVNGMKMTALGQSKQDDILSLMPDSGYAKHLRLS